MMNDTAEADDVGDWLQKKYPAEFGGDRLLIIHTNRSGEVAVKDLDKARSVARDVDSGKSPVNCIVSVVMLREGWDVQSVTVIVGLRPYTAKANILPEQTVGRGLRLMFRDDGNGYHRARGRDRQPEIHRVRRAAGARGRPSARHIRDRQGQGVHRHHRAVPEKLDKDIRLPQLSPILDRKKSLAEEIAALDVLPFACPVLPRKDDDKAAQGLPLRGL